MGLSASLRSRTDQKSAGWNIFHGGASVRYLSRDVKDISDAPSPAKLTQRNPMTLPAILRFKIAVRNEIMRHYCGGLRKRQAVDDVRPSESRNRLIDQGTWRYRENMEDAEIERVNEQAWGGAFLFGV